MEFILGATLASILTIILIAFNNKINLSYQKFQVKTSQSRSHALYPYIPIMIPKAIDTQSTRHREKSLHRILFVNDSAFWIKDNSVYQADVDPNGLIIEGSEKVVDIMGMDKVQLDEMMFIVEKLTEGKDSDNSNSGN